MVKVCVRGSLVNNNIKEDIHWHLVGFSEGGGPLPGELYEWAVCEGAVCEGAVCVICILVFFNIKKYKLEFHEHIPLPNKPGLLCRMMSVDRCITHFIFFIIICLELVYKISALIIQIRSQVTINWYQIVSWSWWSFDPFLTYSLSKSLNTPLALFLSYICDNFDESTIMECSEFVKYPH